MYHYVYVAMIITAFACMLIAELTDPTEEDKQQPDKKCP